MNYLIYIEHAAENLQFYLWFKDYLKRFNNLPASEQALAPTWSAEKDGDQQESKETKQQKQHISPEAAAAFKGTDFAPTANVREVKNNPFNTPPRTPKGDAESVTTTDAPWSDSGSTLNVSRTTGGSHKKQAAEAFETADLKWQPCKCRHHLQLNEMLMVSSHDPTFP